MSQGHRHPGIGLEETHAAGSEQYCPSCDVSYGADATFCPTDGTQLVRLAASRDDMVGSIIAERFAVKSKLGQGGMGAVYRALQQSTGREVAIKIIDPRLGNDREVAKRFLRECKLSTKLAHPGSVTVIDFGQDQTGRLFLAMELVHGPTLAEALRAQRPMPLGRVLRIAHQLLEVLEFAHRQGIVHRDLKPSNIILRDGEDRPVVLDFGLAKSLAGDESLSTVTKSNAMLGTPAYMPPEAAQALPSDERSDLYSLGCILYELLMGRLPYEADTLHMMLHKHMSEAPPPMDGVPGEIAAVVLNLMAKEPAARPASAAAVRANLVSPLALGSTRAPTPIPRRAPGTGGSRSRGWLIVLAVAVLAAAGITAAILVSAQEEAPAPAAAPPPTPAPTPAPTPTPTPAPTPTPTPTPDPSTSTSTSTKTPRPKPAKPRPSTGTTARPKPDGTLLKPDLDDGKSEDFLDPPKP